MKEETRIVQFLSEEGRISEDSAQKVTTDLESGLFSIGFELRAILSIGVLLLSSGLGLLIYKHIDSIGHMAVISIIASISFICLGYSYKGRMPYSHAQVTSPGMIYDYVLLLGCLTFSTFIIYLQYAYAFFGSHQGMPMLLPAILFFYLAYYFDHIGVLSLAIVSFAGFIGIAITPTELLQKNDFSDSAMIFSGLGLGIALAGSAILLSARDIKSHFKFTYFNFATHLLFISCLAGLFMLSYWWLFALLMVPLFTISYIHAVRDRSFYFLLFSVLYGYIAVSDVFFRILRFDDEGIGMAYLGLLYLMGSSVYMIIFLIRSNKKFKEHADIR
jgi:hypothetical protein